MIDNRTPAPLAGGYGEDTQGDIDRLEARVSRYFPRTGFKRKAVYWLDSDGDGARRYADPNEPRPSYALLVIVFVTSSETLDICTTYCDFLVPPGDGWISFGLDARSCFWKRPHVADDGGAA